MILRRMPTQHAPQNRNRRPKDTGSRYDARGRLRNWWTDADGTAFKALAAGLVKQYGACCPVPGYFINGELTPGEKPARLLPGLRHQAGRPDVPGARTARHHVVKRRRPQWRGTGGGHARRRGDIAGAPQAAFLHEHAPCATCTY